MSHKTVNNNEIAALSPAISPEGQAAAKLKVSRPIADSPDKADKEDKADKQDKDETDISLESSVKPSHYLRPNLRPTAPGSEELTFGPANDGTSQKESVFKIVSGLGSKESGWVSFESRNRLNWFIVSGSDKKLYLRERADSDAYRRSATFRILGPSDPNVAVRPVSLP